jgi:hypothetical protein
MESRRRLLVVGRLQKRRALNRFSRKRVRSRNEHTQFTGMKNWRSALALLASRFGQISSDALVIGWADDRRRTTNDSFLQIRHLYRGQRRFESFVSHLQASAIYSLLKRIAGKDAKCVRNAGLLRGLADAACYFVDDDVVMRGVAAQQAAETDDGVVFFSFGQSARGRGNFEGAGDANDFDVVLFCSRANQSVISASQQTVGDELVESGDDDCEAETVRVQFSGECLLPNYFSGGILCIVLSGW